MFNAICLALTLGSTLPAAAQTPQWAWCAPEQLPPVTVRWEDPNQSEVFVVEGERYLCRVATWPARILSLRVDGKDLLGPEGMALSFTDDERGALLPAPRGITPRWEVWRFQNWGPALSSRARMNVWSAGPYYWDAHVLDIPMVPPASAEALAEPAEVLREWSFDADTEGWTPLHNCRAESRGGALVVTSTGDDPFIHVDPVNVQGPVGVRMRVRGTGGGGAFYWYMAGEGGYSGDHVTTWGAEGGDEWHEVWAELPSTGELRGLRLDPPGTSGDFEVDWIRLERLREPDPRDAPVRGELILHAHPDQLRIELRADVPAGQPVPSAATLSVDADAAALEPQLGRPVAILGEGGARAVVLGEPGATVDGGQWTAAVQGSRHSCCWVVRPLGQQEDAVAAVREDLHPLAAEDVEVTGGHWLGYDSLSGLYVMEAEGNVGAFGFEAAFMNPTRRMETSVRLRNDQQDRRLTVKCFTGVGCLEAAVLADEAGFPLPVPVFVAKNFAGEREEPDDAAFGDSYFPLRLAPGERRDFRLFHLMQNWGNHLLKQVSSIRFFHIYWHLSNGASESTCYTHDWMGTGTGSIFHIPDFRPMSGPFWPGQPQHDCQQWPGFLQCNDGRVKLVYEHTDFESVSPCLARFQAYYHTSDDAARARVAYWEAPQRDEMRTFVRLRYDWEKPVEIAGDARRNFRWLNVSEFRHPPERMLWTGADGQTQDVPVETSGEPMLLGEPLGDASPFAASHGKGEDYGCIVLVRGFRARLGGRDMTQMALSASFRGDAGDWWLTVPMESLELQAGDFVEAEVMFLTHGEPTLPALKPERERNERFGLVSPRIPSCTVGERLMEFPAMLRAQGEVARFSVEGGFDNMPIIVEGFRHWGVPMLWNGDLWQDQQAHGGDGYQVEADGRGGYRFIFVYPIRKDQRHELTVTRAECTTGISGLEDANGRPVLHSRATGTFRLKAPVLFAPGQNLLRAGDPIIEFSGEAQAVRAVPVWVSLGEGQARVDVDETGRQVILEGAGASVRFGDLARGREYTVTVNGAAQSMVASGEGELTVQAPGPRSSIVLSGP